MEDTPTYVRGNCAMMPTMSGTLPPAFELSPAQMAQERIMSHDKEWFKGVCRKMNVDIPPDSPTTNNSSKSEVDFHINVLDEAAGKLKASAGSGMAPIQHFVRSPPLSSPGEGLAVIAPSSRRSSTAFSIEDLTSTATSNPGLTTSSGAAASNPGGLSAHYGPDGALPEYRRSPFRAGPKVPSPNPPSPYTPSHSPQPGSVQSPSASKSPHHSPKERHGSQTHGSPTNPPKESAFPKSPRMPVGSSSSTTRSSVTTTTSTTTQPSFPKPMVPKRTGSICSESSDGLGSKVFSGYSFPTSKSANEVEAGKSGSNPFSGFSFGSNPNSTSSSGSQQPQQGTRSKFSDIKHTPVFSSSARRSSSGMAVVAAGYSSVAPQIMHSNGPRRSTSLSGLSSLHGGPPMPGVITPRDGPAPAPTPHVRPRIGSVTRPPAASSATATTSDNNNNTLTVAQPHSFAEYTSTHPHKSPRLVTPSGTLLVQPAQPIQNRASPLGCYM